MIEIERGPPAARWNPKSDEYEWSGQMPAEADPCWQAAPYLFIHIPKTAGHSLEMEFHERKLPFFGHVYPEFYPEKMRDKCKTIVRNPYDRAVSAYFFMRKGGFRNTPSYLAATGHHPTFEKWVLEGLKEEHTRWSADELMLEPCILQAAWIESKAGRRVVSPENVGRFESLGQDVERLFGFPLKIASNVGQHDPWPQYYADRDVRDRIYRLYERDFLLLGYDRGVPTVELLLSLSSAEPSRLLRRFWEAWKGADRAAALALSELLWAIKGPIEPEVYLALLDARFVAIWYGLPASERASCVEDLFREVRERISGESAGWSDRFFSQIEERHVRNFDWRFSLWTGPRLLVERKDEFQRDRPATLVVFSTDEPASIALFDWPRVVRPRRYGPIEASCWPN